MAYCTQSDLAKLISPRELAELTAETGETPDAEVVAECIAKADALIDSYLAVRYALPLSAVPAQVKSLSVDIALYYLFTRRATVGLPPEAVRTKYEDAVKYLLAVSRGQAEVVGADGAELTGDSQEVIEVTSTTRIFDRDKLRGW